MNSWIVFIQLVYNLHEIGIQFYFLYIYATNGARKHQKCDFGNVSNYFESFDDPNLDCCSKISGSNCTGPWNEMTFLLKSYRTSHLKWFWIVYKTLRIPSVMRSLRMSNLDTCIVYIVYRDSLNQKQFSCCSFENHMTIQWSWIDVLVRCHILTWLWSVLFGFYPMIWLFYIHFDKQN